MNKIATTQFSDQNATGDDITSHTNWAFSETSYSELSEAECMTLLRQLIPIGSMDGSMGSEEDFQIIEGAIGYIEQLTGILQNPE